MFDRNVMFTRSLRRVAAAMMPSFMVTASLGQPTDSVWVGGTGSWSAASNWQPPIVPDNAGATAFRVFVDTDAASSSTVFCNGDFGVSGLTVDVGDVLQIVAERSLRIDGAGPIVNNGTIVIGANPGGGATRLWLDDADHTLSGAGVLELTNDTFPGQSLITSSPFTTVRLTQAAGHTIRGAGLITPGSGAAGSTLFLTNHGLIVADRPGQRLRITPTGSPSAPVNFNDGVMRAESGGVLRIENVLDNQGGVIEAFDGSLVEIATEANTGGQALRGGTLRTEGTGVVRITDRSRLTDVTNEGAIEQAANIIVKWAGTLTNDGVYTLADDGAHANTVELRSDVTIAGQGELILQRRVFPEHRIQSAFGELWTLTNGVGHTIRGQGLIGAHDLGFVNDGRVVADASGALEIRAHSSMPVVNHGHMVVASGATLRVRDADFTNNTFTTDGDVTIRAGGTFLRTGGNGAEYIQSDGNTVVKGALTVDEFVRLEAGTLSGSGTITTPQLVNAGGSVEPGNSAGVLTVAGDYVQQAGGELRIELGGPQPGSQHDQLVVQGDAALVGALRVLPIDGFVPQLGQSFVILTAGGLSGTFAEVTGPGAWSVDYSNARVTITVQQTPDPGLDGDCDVDLGDLALLLADFGCSGDGCPGDLDGDGDTDFTDLAVLLANFGALCP